MYTVAETLSDDASDHGCPSDTIGEMSNYDPGADEDNPSDMSDLGGFGDCDGGRGSPSDDFDGMTDYDPGAGENDPSDVSDLGEFEDSDDSSTSNLMLHGSLSFDSCTSYSDSSPNGLTCVCVYMPLTFLPFPPLSFFLSDIHPLSHTHTHTHTFSHRCMYIRIPLIIILIKVSTSFSQS